MKRILLFNVSLIIFLSIQAQDITLSQYDLNMYLLNPAVCGADGFTSFQVTGREQWIGFNDLSTAPSTYAFTFQSRLLKNSYILKALHLTNKHKRSSKSGRVGIGFNVYNDQSGLMSQTGIEGTYAYHIRMHNNQLSFGLTLKAFQYRVDKAAINLGDDLPDDLIDGNDLKSWIFPEANVGAYFSSPEYYVGLSAGNLFESLFEYDDNGNKNAQLERYYNIIGGYTYYFSKQFALEPSALIRIYEIPYMQMDFKVKALYKDSYWGSLAYRTSGGGQGGWLIIGLGLKYEKFYFGYSFDYTFGDIMKFSYGTHEITAAIKLGDNARRYKWLNRY
jgi:type IX secretion system PorP/SprF family membrane protein